MHKEQWLLCAYHFLSVPLCGIYYIKHVGLSERKISGICLELVIRFGIFSWGFYKTLAHGVLKYCNDCFYVLHHDNNLVSCSVAISVPLKLSSSLEKFSNSSNIRLYASNGELHYPLSNQLISKESKLHSVRSRISRYLNK